MTIVRPWLLAGLLVAASGCGWASPDADEMRGLCAAARTAIDAQDDALLRMDDAAWAQAADAVRLVVEAADAAPAMALATLARQWQDALAAARAAPDRAEAFRHLIADGPGPAFRIATACEASGIAMFDDRPTGAIAGLGMALWRGRKDPTRTTRDER